MLPRAGPGTETWCYYAGVTRLAWVFMLPIVTAPARAEHVQLDAIPTHRVFDARATPVSRGRTCRHFTMIEVSDHPKPGCTEEDREADEPRTLFLH